MVAALELHQDCELAHCPLVIVDEEKPQGKEPTWPDCTVFADGLPDIKHAACVARTVQRLDAAVRPARHTFHYTITNPALHLCAYRKLLESMGLGERLSLGDEGGTRLPIWCMFRTRRLRGGFIQIKRPMNRANFQRDYFQKIDDYDSPCRCGV
jgi:hypothetical protein